jgi:chemotaxis signal transduction protein
MDISVDVETSSFSLKSFQGRYILTQVGHQKIGFPSQWVAEIILIERSQILNLPFYDSRLLGVVHHQGSIIPLVTFPVGNPVSQRARNQEMLTAIRLSPLLNELAGVGLIVDQVIGSISQEELSAKEHKATESSNPQIEVFQPERISPSIWQPR